MTHREKPVTNFADFKCYLCRYVGAKIWHRLRQLKAVKAVGLYKLNVA